MIRGSRCEDCGPRCEVCDRTAYCWSEQTAPPCLHDRPLCEGCRLEACPECRRDALANMAESGAYDPRRDPFYRETGDEPGSLADVLAQQRADLAAREAESGFSGMTNQYERRA